MATHWKKLTNPDYLGAYAFAPDQEITGTILTVQQETVTGPEGKQELCTVARFAEPDLKPLILNATNCKTISAIYKTPYIEEWAGKRITMRVQRVRAFGEVVDAVRIKPEIPQSPQNVIPCECCGKAILPVKNKTAAQVAEITLQKYGLKLCSLCATKKAQESPRPAQ